MTMIKLGDSIARHAVCREAARGIRAVTLKAAWGSYPETNPAFRGPVALGYAPG